MGAPASSAHESRRVALWHRGAQAGGIGGLGQLQAHALGDDVHVGAVLDDHRHRLVERGRVDVLGAQQQERARPVDRLGDRRRLLEVQLAHHADDLHEPPRDRLGELGRVQLDDRQLVLQAG